MTKRILTIAALAGSLAGCGGAISQTLVDARETVQTAQHGQTNEVNPDEVLEAQRLLERAEAASDGSETEQHYAYLADRHARLAIAHANTEMTRDEMDRMESDHTRRLENEAIAQQATIEQQQQAIADTREQLADVRTELEARGDVIDERTQELRAREAELSARMDELMQAREAQATAEQQAADAMSRLRELAQMRETATETIITLSGEVLFETDRADLRGTAERRLSMVADALREGSGSILIVGHTDSRGSDDHNRELSRDRAQAVQSFLTHAGVEADRIRVEGRGESQPIASNATPEGRANNRRVEIHIQRGDAVTTARP
ncbi:MAG: OmpA family protein [Sandaracinaceae bacterium]